MQQALRQMPAQAGREGAMRGEAAHDPSVLGHRLQAIERKHWEQGTTLHCASKALGAPDRVARKVAANSGALVA